MSNNEVENKNRSIARILVDADACPMKVRSIVEAKSREHGLKLILLIWLLLMKRESLIL